MGAGKTTLIGAIARPSGCRRHGHQPHVRAWSTSTTGPTATAASSTSTSTASTDLRGGLRLRLRRVFLFGQPLSGGVAREDRAAAARRHDDGAHPRGRPRAAHAVHRLRRPDEPAGRRTVAVRAVSFAPQGSDARFLHEADHQRKRIDHHAVHHGDQRPSNPFNSNPTEGHSPTSATTPAA